MNILVNLRNFKFMLESRLCKIPPQVQDWLFSDHKCLMCNQPHLNVLCTKCERVHRNPKCAELAMEGDESVLYYKPNFEKYKGREGPVTRKRSKTNTRESQPKKPRVEPVSPIPGPSVSRDMHFEPNETRDISPPRRVIFGRQASMRLRQLRRAPMQPPLPNEWCEERRLYVENWLNQNN